MSSIFLYCLLYSFSETGSSTEWLENITVLNIPCVLLHSLLSIKSLIFSQWLWIHSVTQIPLSNVVLSLWSISNRVLSLFDKWLTVHLYGWHAELSTLLTVVSGWQQCWLRYIAYAISTRGALNAPYHTIWDRGRHTERMSEDKTPVKICPILRCLTPNLPLHEVLDTRSTPSWGAWQQMWQFKMCILA